MTTLLLRIYQCLGVLLINDSVWSLTTGSLPQCSYLLPLPPEPEIIYDIETSLWVPYTDDGDYSFKPNHASLPSTLTCKQERH